MVVDILIFHMTILPASNFGRCEKTSEFVVSVGLVSVASCMLMN
jgi:hypothetical protein